jgi:signal peptidase II
MPELEPHTTPSYPVIHAGRRSADREPVAGWLPAIAVALGVAGLDWITKTLVVVLLPQSELVEVLPGSLAIWHIRNPAMILGLYGELPIEIRKLIALASGLAGVVLMAQVLACGHRLPPRQRPWAWLFVGLVMGGMLGNLGERVVHWGVTDFISLGWNGVWLPPGNFADLALFASVPLAVVVSALELLARAHRGVETPAPAEVMGD